MIYSEIYGDLFSCPKNFALAHCISADYALGKGIAKKFNEIGVKLELLNNYPENNWNGIGYCLKTEVADRIVYNLVTKEKYFYKPTYNTIYQALCDLLICAKKDNIKF